MNDINKIPGDNFGAIASIHFCPIDLVAAIPDAVIGQITQAVTFEPGGQWFNFYHTFETLSFSQKVVNTSQGRHYELIITGFIPNQSNDLDVVFQEMEEKKHLLKITDTNGHIFLVGRIENGEEYGATFSAEYNSQPKVAGLKGYSFQFKLLTPVRAYYYNVSSSGSGS